MSNFDRRASGSEAGGVRRRKTDTEVGEGDTESTTRSYRPSSTDDIGTDVTLFPRWTAPTTATASATTTDPTRLDRRSVFLLREVRPYGDALPRAEKRQLIREGGSTSRVSDHARPRDPGGGTVPTVSPRWTIIDDVSQAVGQSGVVGGGYLSWSSPGVRWCGLNRLQLRTLWNVSVLMMLLDYKHMMARCGQHAVMRNTIVDGGPAGPEVIEPLELLVLDHADPAGQHAVIRDATRLLEHPLARPESSLSNGLVERISDGELAARQVPDTTLDSRPMEGITYLEHLAPGVSLDSGPMEGMSCLEPLE